MRNIDDWITIFQNDELEVERGIVYPKVKDLIYIPLIALLMLCLRMCFTRFIATPLASYFGLDQEKEKARPLPNKYLEDCFKKITKNPSGEETENLAKKLSWKSSQIRRWFKRARIYNRTGELRSKFCESSCILMIRTSTVGIGVFALWKKPWLWDFKECWTNFPMQGVDQSVFLYYICEASLYVYLTIIVNKVRRKDFSLMLIHHLVTLSLISISYLGNFVRIGTVIMFLNDFHVQVMEFAKCCTYIKWQKMADVLFVIFAVVYFVTVVIVYPFGAVYSTWTNYQPTDGGLLLKYYVIMPLLHSLQILQFFWFIMILKVAKNMFIKGKATDVRSDTEEFTDDDCDDNTKEETSESGFNLPNIPCYNSA